MSTVTMRPYRRGGGVTDDITWTYLDETPYSDSDYIEKVGVGSTSYGPYYFYYTVPESAFYGTISSIKICGRAWASGGIYGAIKFAVYIGSTAYGYSGKVVSGTGATYSETISTNPATGVAWTMDDVINLQIGFALSAYAGDPLVGNTYCSQLYVEVNYTTPANAIVQSQTLRPNAVGDTTELIAVGDSSTYLCVDEETADGDTTYVRSGTVSTWKNDLYGLPAVTIGNIQYVAMSFYGRGGGYSGDKARPIIKTHGSTYYDREIDFTVFGSTYKYFWTIWRMNPNTGLAWTPEEINDLQAGVGLYTAFTPPNYPVRCSQVYVYVAGVSYQLSARPQIVGIC